MVGVKKKRYLGILVSVSIAGKTIFNLLFVSKHVLQHLAFVLYLGRIRITSLPLWLLPVAPIIGAFEALVVSKSIFYGGAIATYGWLSLRQWGGGSGCYV